MRVLSVNVSDPLALQNAIARSRTTGPGLLPVYRGGQGYCEGCREYRPRPALAVKGWRCKGCRASK